MSSSGSGLPSLREHLVGRGLDDLRARVEVLVHAVAEAHQLEARCSCPSPGRRTSPRRRRRSGWPSSISSTSWLAPPWSGPQSAQMPALIDAKRFALARADHAHGAGRAVLLVVGVQDEQQVHHLHELGVDLVVLGRDREHHVEEVRAVRERVLRVDERLADRLLVREGRDGPHLRHEARDGDVAHARRCRRRARRGSSSRARRPSRRGWPSGAPSAGSPRRSASCPRGAASGA